LARLGSTFMADWRPGSGFSGWVTPFALFVFGDPERPKRPRRSLEALRDTFAAIDVEQRSQER
jgi:hypothetical protein